MSGEGAAEGEKNIGAHEEKQTEKNQLEHVFHTPLNQPPIPGDISPIKCLWFIYLMGTINPFFSQISVTHHQSHLVYMKATVFTDGWTGSPSALPDFQQLYKLPGHPSAWRSGPSALCKSCKEREDKTSNWALKGSHGEGRGYLGRKGSGWGAGVRCGGAFRPEDLLDRQGQGLWIKGSTGGRKRMHTRFGF